MRIVLHLGQGKTGTKALQHALAAARGLLAERGVLYPEMGECAAAHHLLLPLCAARLPAHVAARWGLGDDAIRAAARAYSALGQEVARTRPEILVLSSETLVFGTGPAEKARLCALLRPLSEEIRPVVYVREPGGLYLARLLEKMRVAAVPLPPAPQRIRGALEELEAAIGVPPEVLAFDPAALLGGDVVSDFVRRFLAERVEPALIPPRRQHASLSAEASLALARLRAEVAAGRDWEPEPASRRLARQLTRIEAREGAPRARLRAGIAEAIRRASADYLWLRDRFGLAFPEIDYAAVDGAPLPGGMAALPHEGILEIDRDRYERLVLAALRAELERPR